MRVIQSKYTTTGKAYIVTTKQASDTENQKEKDLVIVVHYLLQLENFFNFSSKCLFFALSRWLYLTVFGCVIKYFGIHSFLILLKKGQTNK